MHRKLWISVCFIWSIISGGKVALYKGLPEECGSRPDTQTPETGYKKRKQEAPAHSWPSHVGVYSTIYGAYPFCGGTLIAPSWVLTAAHCAIPDEYCSLAVPLGKPFSYSIFDGNTLAVRVGSHNFTQKEPLAHNVEVKHIVIERRYQVGFPMGGYDVALLKLDRELETSEHVDFACLPEFGTKLETGEFVYSAGWGLIPDLPNPPLEDQPEVLMEVRVPIVDPSKCLERHLAFDKNLHFCTDSSYGATCTGDSGGGVYHYADDGTWVIYGVNSYTGREYTAPFSVKVLTESVRHWIKDTVVALN